jgi:multisubunit Na+/H+ antiporter MnhC subunit
MRNRNVGFLVLGIAAIMAIIVLLFNNLIKTNIGLTCSHGPTCEMYAGLNVQTWIALIVVGIIFIIGLFLVFAKEHEKIIIQTKTKKIIEKKKPLDLSGLDAREKEVVKLLQKEGAIFQATLMEKLGIGKVGLTRLLDKLEAKQIIERKRRGMNNIVVLK